MFFGTTYTLVHVFLSLIAIASGIVVAYGLVNAKRFNRWTVLFLVTTLATNLTAFGFALASSPGDKIAMISIGVLLVASVARYDCELDGPCRWIYVITAMMALYLNVFVLILHAFQKVSTLKALAPTGYELPFLIAQEIILVLFVWLTVVAVKRFRSAT